jgi:SAM-dependent MidA family methyltransferase
MRRKSFTYLSKHFQALLESESITPEQKEILKSSVNMMINPDSMGERFKFFSMFPSVLDEHLKKFPVLGFA